MPKGQQSNPPQTAMPMPAPAMTAWLDIMQEGARFLTDRLQQDLEMQQAMLACRTPAELMDLQQRFYQTAIADYTEQATKVFGLATQAVGAGLSAGRARKYDDVPL